MTVSEAYKTTRILEALENYAVSDDHSSEAVNDIEPQREASSGFHSDGGFWRDVLTDPSAYVGKELKFRGIGLSEWVARVPGLYWSKGSDVIRLMAKDNIEFNNGYGTTFTPLGKTQKVFGGIGTFKFAPDDFGRKLVLLSHNNNASTGIPVLISPEVWEHHRLEEGSILNLKGVWRGMSQSWAERFPSIKGIPRNYLVVDKLEQVERVISRDSYMMIQPCSILKYESQGGLFYDFVFCSRNSDDPNCRDSISRFFDKYKSDTDHRGEYLIEMDISLPILGAEFNSPKELRAEYEPARTHLDLIEERIKQESFNDHTIDNIIRAVNLHCDNDTLIRLSERIGIDSSLWFRDTAVVDSSAALVDLCLENDHLDEFVDALVQWNPEILKFNNS